MNIQTQSGLSPDFTHAQRELAFSLGNLGVAVRESKEKEEIIACFDQLQSSIGQFIRTEKMDALRSLFSLSDLDLSLLAILYINLIEPDTVEPYLNQTWYERGPTLTLERMLILCRGGGDAKTNNIGILLTESNLVKWRLCYLTETNYALYQQLMISPVVFTYLVSGKTEAYPDYLPFIQPQRAAHWPSVLYTFEDTLVYDHPIVELSATETSEKTSYIQAYCSRRKSEWVIFENSEGLLEIEELRFALQYLQLNFSEQNMCIYWPSVTKYMGAGRPYMELIDDLIESERFALFYDQDTENDIDTGVLANTKFLKTRNILDLNKVPDSLAWYYGIYQHLSPSFSCGISVEQSKELSNLYPLTSYKIDLILNKLADSNKCFENTELFNLLKEECVQSFTGAVEGLAKIHRPKYQIKDMVLSADTQEQLNEIMNRVRYSADLRESINNFVPGLQVLFWGKPGTGKSMAAEAIAGELRLPFYKVNLANIASKWIGETEKHLAKLFDDAQRQNAILLFDEADAIFAKRSEVESSHDKNANMGVSFLLQRMETFTGLLLLTSNFKSNLDDAFLRRFHSTIEFPLPSESDREVLWRNALEPMRSRLTDKDFKALSSIFEFGPSQISNIAERALLFSLVDNTDFISKHILARAIRRELEKQSAGYLAEQNLAEWIN